MVRSGFASLAGVAVEFGLLTLLVSVLHIHYLVGAVVAGAAYFLVNFVINRRYAFRSSEPRVGLQFARHAAVTAGGMAIATPLLWLFVGGLGLIYQAGWAASGTVAFFGWTFPMHRFFTYRVRGPTPLPP